MVAVLAQLQLVPCTGPRMYQSSRWKHSYARRPQVVYTLLAKCSGIAKALVHQTPLPKGKLNFILLSRTSYSCHQKNSFMFRIFFSAHNKENVMNFPPEISGGVDLHCTRPCCRWTSQSLLGVSFKCCRLMGRDPSWSYKAGPRSSYI